MTDDNGGRGVGDRGALQRIADVARAAPAEVGLLALLALVVLGGSAFAFLRRPEPPAPVIERSSADVVEEPRILVVHVAGAVAKPGLYELPEGSRVADAIEAAGGAADGAGLDLLNLAAVVADGEKIFVPKPGQAASPGGGAEQQGKISLNAATAEELEELPGIGPVFAERIVQYRQQHGGFTSVEQLLEIEGIGPKRYESLKDLVTV